MEKYSYNRASILQSLDELCKEISDNRFISTRPISVNKEMQDFIIIRLPQVFRQEGDAGQFTNGQIVLFARDRQGNIENTTKLDAMTEAVTALFPIVTEQFVATRPKMYYGGTDELGFHSLIIQFEIQIK
jgi:hypothetical protein